MNAEKGYKIVGILAILMGIVSMTIGKFILAFILFVFGIGVFWTSRKGSYNDKNLYDKKVPANGKSLEELFAFVENTDTPLGNAWMGKFKGRDAIIFGPTAFKDIVSIALEKNTFIIRNTNVVEYLEADEEDKHNLERVLDTSDMAVTPKRYSIFAALKVMSAVMVGDLVPLVEGFAEGTRTNAPESITMFEFFRHNNQDDKLYDMDDNVILDIDSNKVPLRVIVKSEEGEELARVICRNPAFKDATNEIFDIYSDGDVFGSIYQDRKSDKNRYIIETVNGDFVAESFMAVRKANVSANYEISYNGERKAVVFGTANLNFGEEGGWLQNNVICSFDEEYIVLYTVFQLFLMNTSDWLR